MRIVSYSTKTQAEIEAMAMKDPQWKKEGSLRTRAAILGEVPIDCLSEVVETVRMGGARTSQFYWGVNAADLKNLVGEGKLPPQVVWNQMACGSGRSERMTLLEHPFYKGIGKTAEFYEDLMTVMHTTLMDKVYRDGQAMDRYEQNKQNSQHPPKEALSLTDVKTLVNEFRATKLGASAPKEEAEEDAGIFAEEVGAASVGGGAVISSSVVRLSGGQRETIKSLLRAGLRGAHN